MLAAPVIIAIVTTTAMTASIAGRKGSTDTRVWNGAAPLSSDETMALFAKFGGVATRYYSGI
jgi:hypothetical protein